MSAPQGITGRSDDGHEATNARSIQPALKNGQTDADDALMSRRGPLAVRNGLNMEGGSAGGAALMGKINDASKDKGIREMKEVRPRSRSSFFRP